MTYHHKNGLSLSKLTNKDLSDAMAAKNYAWPTMHSSPFIGPEDQGKWFDGLGDAEYHAAARRGGAVVGYLSLTRVDWVSRSASVTMMARPEEKGRGWTRKLPEALTDFGFEYLNLRRLEAEVLDNNPAALHYDLGVGYSVEGRKRQAVYKCGRYHDSILIALLRDEWERSDRVRGYGGVCNTQYRERGPIDRVIARSERRK